MKTILVTNDDGYTSAGYVSLLQALSKEYHIIAVVPSTKKSWIGKAVTAYDTLKITPLSYEGFELYTINGTPADCVQIGLYHIMNSRPDAVISGINLGTNIGTARLLSSGTIGAAMEATLASIPSIAFSLSIPKDIRRTHDLYSKTSVPLFHSAAEIAQKLSRTLLESNLTKKIFSVNMPYQATISSTLEITIPFDVGYGPLFQVSEKQITHVVPPVEYTDMKKERILDFGPMRCIMIFRQMGAWG